MTTTLHQTSEITSLLNYERRSNNRHGLIRNLAVGFVVVLALVVILLAIHKPHHVLQNAYLMMGLPRSAPNNLNSKPTSAPQGCESTIMLIRHCDKDDPTTIDDEHNRHCSQEGFQRSFFLQTLFGTRWPIPAKLYALSGKRKGHKNYREMEILEPLSSKIGVKINSKYGTEETQAMVDELYHELRSGNLCGKLTVFAWKHSHMPELAHALGWKDSPSHYPATSFDQVWQIKYVFNPNPIYNDHRHMVKAQGQRALHGSISKAPDTTSMWVVYGNIGYQYFDPLSFSYEAGDYPSHGKERGEGWLHDL